MDVGEVWQEIPNSIQQRLRDWSKLEQESGTGLIKTSYRRGAGTVTWKNNFLSRDDKFPPPIAGFVLGYIKGVLEKLLEAEITIEMTTPTKFRFRQQA